MLVFAVFTVRRGGVRKIIRLGKAQERRARARGELRRRAAQEGESRDAKANRVRSCEGPAAPDLRSGRKKRGGSADRGSPAHSPQLTAVRAPLGGGGFELHVALFKGLIFKCSQ